MESCLAVAIKAEHMHYPYPRNSTPGYIPNWNVCNVHQKMYNRDIFQNRQMSTNNKIDQSWHILTLQYKTAIGMNNQQICILNNMDESHNKMWNERPIHQTVYRVTLYKIYKHVKLIYIVKVKMLVTLGKVVRKDWKGIWILIMFYLNAGYIDELSL